MALLLLIVVLVAVQLFVVVNSWGAPSSGVMTTAGLARRMANRAALTMEYIPDGMSKAQWDALKKKEQDEMKGKNLGAIGITKFKSRSFEAWQKSGGKNLFPVDPNSPDYVKPYMQRKGGMADGSDLVKKGVNIKKLTAGAKPIARNELDAKYDELEGKGLLRSSPFELPWSNSQAAKLATAKLSEEQKAKQAEKKAKMASGKSAPTPAPVSKGISFSFGGKKPAPPPPPAPEPPKKKLFGLF
jgi:hypothetical protein